MRYRRKYTPPQTGVRLDMSIGQMLSVLFLFGMSFALPVGIYEKFNDIKRVSTHTGQVAGMYTENMQVKGIQVTNKSSDKYNIVTYAGFATLSASLLLLVVLVVDSTKKNS